MNTDWKRRDSFILYTDHKDQIDRLSMEQRGLLLTAIMTYQDKGELIDLDDTTAMLFSILRQEFDRNAVKYDKVVEQRRRAGSAGGRKSARNRQRALSALDANEAFAAFAAADEANQADNDNEYDNEDVDEYGNDSCSSTTTTTQPFKPPDEAEVIAQLEEFEHDPDLILPTARSFLRYNAADNWLSCQRHYSSWEYALIKFLEHERTT